MTGRHRLKFKAGQSTQGATAHLTCTVATSASTDRRGNFLCDFGPTRSTHLATKSGSNGSPTSPHGLILSEDEATAYTKLLEAFPAPFGIVSGLF